jgi:hypothetical protein
MSDKIYYVNLTKEAVSKDPIRSAGRSPLDPMEWPLPHGDSSRLIRAEPKFGLYLD